MHWSKLYTTIAAHPWPMKKWTVCFQVWVKERVRLTLYLNYCNKYLGFYAKQMSDSENNNLSICTNKLNDESLCTSPLHTGTNTLSSLVMSVSYLIPSYCRPMVPTHSHGISMAKTKNILSRVKPPVSLGVYLRSYYSTEERGRNTKQTMMNDEWWW